MSTDPAVPRCHRQGQAIRFAGLGRVATHTVADRSHHCVMRDDTLPPMR